MKIAISVCGTEDALKMDSHFGRAEAFLFVDEESGEKQYVSNKDNKNAMQGAGVQSGQFIIDNQVDAVISGHIGPKAFNVLNSGSIKIYNTALTDLDEVLKAFRAGELTEQV